jgi:hypothetical protein
VSKKPDKPNLKKSSTQLMLSVDDGKTDIPEKLKSPMFKFSVLEPGKNTRSFVFNALEGPKGK